MVSSSKRREELLRVLNPENLILNAQEQADLRDFGDDHFMLPMRKLIECAINDVNFHDHGAAVLKAEIERILVNRLRAEHDFKQYPEILDEDVSDPIIIIGLGRSGTTKLQRMLSAPDDVQKTFLWRLLNPAPFPDTVPGAPDPRIKAADITGTLDMENKEERDKGHVMDPLEVEEDAMLYPLTFEDWLVWGGMAPSHSYYDWVMQRDFTEAYRYVKKILQYLQWQDGGKINRPWILKSVAHIAHLDPLMACYPNATLVHAHRDPMECIPSWAKLTEEHWQITSLPSDPHLVGQKAILEFKTSMDRYLEARERLGLDDRILDIRYEDIRNDAMAVMKAVYDKAGRPMSAAAKQKMDEWDQKNEQGKHGKHKYSLEIFGLTPGMINEAFDSYIDRFITGP
ncbi:MAG: sulfotransferase [Halieaceae bacterium]|nr:sulfotransferase [Halieaceae bacterium]